MIPFAALAAICCSFSVALADGDTAIQEAAQKLAERVGSIPGLHGALRLEWHAAASWSEGESTRWQEIVKGEIGKRALSLSEDTGVPVLAVFAAETPTQIVLTARTRVSDREEIRMVNVARALLPAGSPPVAPVRLERQLIYESADRVLDAASPGSGEGGGLALLLYRNFELLAVRVDVKGVVKESVSLSAANLKPTRDPRGELTTRGSSVTVELLGKTCEFSWEAPGEVKCHAEKSAAAEQSLGRGPTLLASPCGGSNWKLLSSGGEPNAREVLQVLPEGAQRESSAAVLSEFPGPILGTNRTQSPAGALVISQNLRTGTYEIYKIALACGN
ncbi:MAG TPA: hypothetical protein VFI38_09720 [Candidatus Acidoferrum sp.]|nr:hypothetical protein [Candidatus Acidoferrum sp.]